MHRTNEASFKLVDMDIKISKLSYMQTYLLDEVIANIKIEGRRVNSKIVLDHINDQHDSADTEYLKNEYKELTQIIKKSRRRSRSNDICCVR